MIKYKDGDEQFIGRKFGRWTVISSVRSEYQGRRRRLYAKSRCECGTEKDTRLDILFSGESLSCGCLMRENVQRTASKYGLVGVYKTRLYKIWQGMLSRCYNLKKDSYHNYGQRGITVCIEWHNFANFREWALTHGYQDDLTIDRINNHGNYTPENCRWTTRREQNRNSRHNRFLTAFGETKMMVDWSLDSRNVVTPRTFKSRMGSGWAIEKALLTPSRRH